MRCASRCPKLDAGRGDRACAAAASPTTSAGCTVTPPTPRAAQTSTRSPTPSAGCGSPRCDAERAELHATARCAGHQRRDAARDRGGDRSRGDRSSRRHACAATADGADPASARAARRHVRSRALRAPAPRRRRAARARRCPKCAWFRPAIRRIAARPAHRPRDRLAMLRARASPNFRGLVVDGAKSTGTARATRCSRSRSCAAKTRSGRSWLLSAPTRFAGCRPGIAGASMFGARASRRRRAAGRGARPRDCRDALAAEWQARLTARSRGLVVARPPAPSIEQRVSPQPISATAIRAQLARGTGGRRAVARFAPARRFGLY